MARVQIITEEVTDTGSRRVNIVHTLKWMDYRLTFFIFTMQAEIFLQKRNLRRFSDCFLAYIKNCSEKSERGRQIPTLWRRERTILMY